MAVKMVLFWFSLIILIIGSHAAGEFTVLHSPDSLKFFGQTTTPETVLKEVVSASLGLSVAENKEWNGFRINDPFNTPEAVVEIYIDGISRLFENEKGTVNYPLLVDEYEPDTYEAVSQRIRQHFNSGRNKLVKINLSNPKDLSQYEAVFGDIPAPTIQKLPLEHLKMSNEEDYQFLNELSTLYAIIDKVRSGVLKPDNMIDFFYFRFTSLHALSDFHGPNAPATKEAKKLAAKAIHELSSAFDKAYDGAVLVTVVTTDVAHTRRAIRAAGNDQRAARAPFEEEEYSEDYPVIFNIILWFAVVLVFTLVAIVYAIMDMDPGRDSIIYRMTSMRTKKEN